MPLGGIVSGSSLIGVAIACGGNVLISLALTVQKLAHRRQQEELSQRTNPTSQAESSEDEEDGSSDQAGSDGTPDDEARPRLKAIPVVVVVEQGGADNPTGDDGPPKLAIRAASPTEAGLVSAFDPHSPSGSPLPTKAGSYEISISPRPSDTRAERKRSRHGGDEEEGKQGDEDPKVQEGMYLKSRLWWLGLCLIAVGEGGNFLSYGFAPASVVAPLGIVALIANCIFAPLILGERFYKRELFGMGLAILGAVTVVWASNDSNPRLNPDQLLHAIVQPVFIAYLVITLVLVVPLILLSRSHYGDKYILIDLGVCCIAGGYTVLSTKALSSLLSTMFLTVFRYKITWGLVAVLIAGSLTQVRFLNLALMRFQSKEVIPVQFVGFSLSAIIGSAVLYQEFRDLPLARFVNFAFGIATTFFGVWLLTSPARSESSPSSASSTRPHSPRPAPPHRTSTLEVLLPPSTRARQISLSSISPSERTPLFISHVAREAPGTETLLSPSGTLSRTVSRLGKRRSSDFTPTLLSSQAGFLLMATTPPRVNLLEGREVKGARKRDRASSVNRAEGLDIGSPRGHRDS